MNDSLQALFRPERLAVVGASAKPGKLGFTIFKNILDAGFGGPVISVNHKRSGDLPQSQDETVLGVLSVRSIDQILPGNDLGPWSCTLGRSWVRTR